MESRVCPLILPPAPGRLLQTIGLDFFPGEIIRGTTSRKDRVFGQRGNGLEWHRAGSARWIARFERLTVVKLSTNENEIGTAMTHPLVLQLRFTRSEFIRGV